jgi:hypothetical protein
MAEENLPPNSSEGENENNSTPLNWNEFLKLIEQFLHSENGAKLIEKFFGNKEKLIENNRLNIEKQYDFASTKYWQDIFMVSIILGSIISIIFISKSSSIPFINETTIGTLLGGIIGYALARFKNN